MLQEFNAFLDKVIKERLTEIINHIAVSNPQYMEFTREIITVSEYIVSSISGSCKETLEELKDLLNARESLVMEIVYRQGIKDGIDIQFILSKKSK